MSGRAIDEEVEEAKGIVDAYKAAVARGIGTIDYKGKMIDGPLLKRAEAVLTIANIVKDREQG